MVSPINMNSSLFTSGLLSRVNGISPLKPVGGSTPWSFPPPNPFWLPSSPAGSYGQFAKKQAGALVGLADQAQKLKTSASALDAASPASVWQKRSVASSSAASVSGTAKNGAKLAAYNVNVTQIAEAQVNTGSALNAAAVSGLAGGSHSFSITVGGKTKNISFAVGAGDTNQTALTKMAQSINGAKAGVTASVTKNNAAGTSQLVITSNQTGAANAFSLKDLSGTAVAGTGAGTVGKAAADAVYSVDGKSFTSGQNTVTLPDPNVSITLIAPVNGATVKVEHDTSAITTAIKDYADVYNRTISYLSEHEHYLSSQPANTLKSAYGSQAPLLQNAGITAKSDGTLKVDQAVLENSVKNNPTRLMQPLGGFAGLATAGGSLAERITSGPLHTFAKPISYSSVYSGPAFGSPFGGSQPGLSGGLFNRLF
jgi:flagellar hook-associated protein 2